jgi:hypothetical protein
MRVYALGVGAIMVKLLHEVWEDTEADGQSLSGCCLAGPDGDAFRKLLSSNAHMIYGFEAGSHFEAMTTYYRLMGWGVYTTTESRDVEPYPADWLTRQRSS